MRKLYFCLFFVLLTGCCLFNSGKDFLVSFVPDGEWTYSDFKYVLETDESGIRWLNVYKQNKDSKEFKILGRMRVTSKSYENLEDAFKKANTAPEANKEKASDKLNELVKNPPDLGSETYTEEIKNLLTK